MHGTQGEEVSFMILIGFRRWIEETDGLTDEA